MGGPEPYRVLQVDGKGIAGMLPLTPEMGPMPPNWTSIFGVEDTDAASPEGPRPRRPGARRAVRHPAGWPLRGRPGSGGCRVRRPRRLNGADPDRLALGAFLGAVLIGGTNFVAVRFSNRELDPLWGAGLRFGLAAIVFGVLCAVFRLTLPRGRVLTLVLVYGLLSFAGAYGCLYWALQDVPAGIAAVVMAVGPLLTLLLAVAHRQEHLHARGLAGALIALAGSVLIFFQPDETSFGVASLVLLGLAALCASESVVISKSVGAQHPLVMNFVAMTAGAAVLIAVSALAGETLALPHDGETQLAVAYLVAATVGLFVFVLVVIQRWTASTTSYIFVLMPDRRGRDGRPPGGRGDHPDDAARRGGRVRGGVRRSARPPLSGEGPPARPLSEPPRRRSA